MSHVLVARLDSLGDVLVTGPAIRAVAARADTVTMLCGPGGRAAAELLPGVDDIVQFEAPWILAEPAPVDGGEMLELVGRISVLGIDAAVIFTSFHQSPLPLALLLRMAHVPFVAAISTDYPGSLLDVRHLVRDDIHEVERALSLAKAAGFPRPLGDDTRLAVHLEERERTPLEVELGPPYLVVHPGASVSARAWAPERHRTLVHALVDSGRHVVVTGGPAERALTAFVAGSGGVDLGGRLDLPALASVIGNTGPAHLAAAMSTPVVSLYAPTVPAVRWRPWQVPHVLLGAQDIGCAGCRAHVCPVGGHPCLDIEVNEVLDALESLAVEVPVA